MDAEKIVAKVRAMSPSARVGVVALLGWMPTWAEATEDMEENEGRTPFFIRLVMLFALVGFIVISCFLIRSWLRCKPLVLADRFQR